MQARQDDQTGKIMPISTGPLSVPAASVEVSAIGIAIRAARKRSGLTQEQLAELAETAVRTVRDVEKGTGSPSIRIVARVADVLGLKLVVLG